MKLSCKSLYVFYKHSGVGVHCKIIIFHFYVSEIVCLNPSFHLTVHPNKGPMPQISVRVNLYVIPPLLSVGPWYKQGTSHKTA